MIHRATATSRTATHAGAARAALALVACLVARPLATAAQPVATAVPASATRDVTLEVPLGATGGGYAVVHVPAGVDARRPLHVVVFFHGWGVCARRFVRPDARGCGRALPSGPGCGSPDRFDAVPANAVLVIPQLGGAHDGGFDHPGTLRGLLDRVLRETLASRLGGPRGLADLEGITLVAHSAGSGALARAVGDVEIARRVRAVVLFDPAAVDAGRYLRWLRRGGPRGRLVVVHGGGHATRAQAAALVAAAGLAPSASATVATAATLVPRLATHQVVVAAVPYPHGWIPWLYFAKVLEALELPTRPPEPGAPLPDDLVTPAGVVVAVAPGAVVAGSLARDDARTADGSAADDYALPLAAGQRVTLEVRGGRSRTDPAVPLDVAVRVYDAAREVARDDDALGGLGSRVTLEAPRAATYTVRVTTYGPALREGPYQLVVADPALPPAARRPPRRR